jgi:hypothetical protein
LLSSPKPRRSAGVASLSALEEAQPFFRQTTDPIREQIVPFARRTQPTFEELRRTSTALSDATPALRRGFGELNKLANALAHDPAGPAEGYLFWAAWLGHDTNAMYTLQDADGSFRRLIPMQSCQTAQLAEGTAELFPPLKTLLQATRVPLSADIC